MIINEINSNADIESRNIPNGGHNKYFKDQYHFDQIGLKETYKYLAKEGKAEGGAGVTVAVIDTGVDLDHEDLIQNIWVNAAEIPNNGIDDDENGYVDDVNGWNCVDQNNNPDVFLFCVQAHWLSHQYQVHTHSFPEVRHQNNNRNDQV